MAITTHAATTPTATTSTAGDARLGLEAIRVPQNVRDLDTAHVSTLAASIELQGLIVPIVVCRRPDGDGFDLVAGFHRLAAVRQLGHSEIPVVIRDAAGEDTDRAIENVARKQLTPYEEARAVKAMLDRGLTELGAAQALGWPRQRVSARVKILALPERAQQLIGCGEIPLAAIDPLRHVHEISPPVGEALIAYLDSDDGRRDASNLAASPGMVLGTALRHFPGKVFARFLNQTDSREITELRLGKKATAQYASAEKLHRSLDAHAYGPPRIAFTEAQVDRARAAGVLIELERSAPIITDRGIYRDLVKEAIAETEARLCERAETAAAQKRTPRTAPADPETLARQERDRQLRTLSEQAHSVNLDLGNSLLCGLACVDPADMNVAKVFVFGLLGPDIGSQYGPQGEQVARIAMGGLRLMLAEMRTDVTRTRKDGTRGTLKIAYPEKPESAVKWLWQFLDGARTAGELYGRALVVLAAEQHASRLVLPRSRRGHPTRWASRKDIAMKALGALASPHLPATLTQLEKAVAKTHRAYDRAQATPARGRRSTAPDAVESDVDLGEEEQPAEDPQPEPAEAVEQHDGDLEVDESGATAA